MAEHLRTELVADALSSASPTAILTARLIFHSDRSGQYTGREYATLASEFAVTLSVRRTGKCWDNALAESFFASLKGECLDKRIWPTRASARRAIVDYIAWFNSPAYTVPSATKHTQRARSSHRRTRSREGGVINPTTLREEYG